MDVEIVPEPPDEVRRALLSALSAPPEPPGGDAWWRAGLDRPDDADRVGEPD